MKTGKIAKTFRVDSGKHFRLKDFDPGRYWALALQGPC